MEADSGGMSAYILPPLDAIAPYLAAAAPIAFGINANARSPVVDSIARIIAHGSGVQFFAHGQQVDDADDEAEGVGGKRHGGNQAAEAGT